MTKSVELLCFYGMSYLAASEAALCDTASRFELNFCRTPCFYLLPVARVEMTVGHGVMDEERLTHLVEMRSYLVVCLHDVTEMHILQIQCKQRVSDVTR